MSSDPDPAEGSSPADHPFAAFAVSDAAPPQPNSDSPNPTDFEPFRSAAFWIRWTGCCLVVISAISFPMFLEGQLGLLITGAALVLGLTLSNVALNLDNYARDSGRDPRALASAMQGLARFFWGWTLLSALLAPLLLLILSYLYVGGR